MRTATVIVNAILFFATVALVVRCFRKDGEWRLRHGLGAFRYFTILSNVLCALSALAVAVCVLRGDVPEGVLRFKYVGTASVTVTMLTVLFFLGPTQGYGLMLRGDSLFLHLIDPLLAVVSFCFMEKGEMAFTTALLGMLPVLLYGPMYLYRIRFAPQDRRWEDFYGFNAGGRWPVMFAAMLLGTLATCVLLWLL